MPDLGQLGSRFDLKHDGEASLIATRGVTLKVGEHMVEVTAEGVWVGTVDRKNALKISQDAIELGSGDGSSSLALIIGRNSIGIGHSVGGVVQKGLEVTGDEVRAWGVREIKYL